MCCDLVWLFENISTFVETSTTTSQRLCTRNRIIATFPSLRFHSKKIVVTIEDWVGSVSKSHLRKIDTHVVFYDTYSLVDQLATRRIAELSLIVGSSFAKPQETIFKPNKD